MGGRSARWACRATEPHIFSPEERELILTQADLYAQALARVSLMEARETLLAGLEAQRNRLEAVIQQMPAGVLIADGVGRLVLSNGRAAEIWRVRFRRIA